MAMNIKDLNPAIFRSYDIRGIYPKDINKEVAELIGNAIGSIVLEDSKKSNPTIVIGRDMRIGSPDVSEGLITGLVKQGINVVDIGLVPVDAVYFAVGKHEYDAGIMVTASHNPKDYAGLKMVLKGTRWLRGIDVLEYIKRHEDEFENSSKGVITERNIWDDYIAHVHSFVDLKSIKPFTVVIDAGNGMAGKAIPQIMKDTPIKVIEVDFELDGSFPNRDSNPLAENVTEKTAAIIEQEKADFGVLFDGDTDRLIFVDEKGKKVKADTGLIILAQHLLKKEPGKTVSYNAICTKAVPEIVESVGGRAVRTPVGYVHVCKAMQDHDGIIGGEVSAHYSFAKNYYADSGMAALMLMLEIVSEDDRPFSELVNAHMPYHRADEVNLEIEDKQGVIEAIKLRYKDVAEIDELDGVTCHFDDWWFNVRPSNTEPLLRITVEAQTEEEVINRRDEVVSFVESI